MTADRAQLDLFEDGRPWKPAVRRCRREAERTIAALRAVGRLEDADRLLIALVRTTADVADERRNDPDAAFHLTQALKLLAELETRLRGLSLPDHDPFADLLAAAAHPAAPRDA